MAASNGINGRALSIFGRDDVVGAIDHVLSEIGDPPALGDANRVRTVVSLLKRLKQFAVNHYNFFDDGLISANGFKLRHSKVFSDEAVLGTILSKISEDVELIWRAANQRKNPNLAEAFQVADGLAYRAMRAAEKALGYKNGKVKDGEGEEYTVLTYFQKGPEIRVVPYAPIALIGVPLTALHQPRDLLAISHEIGHFIYNNRKQATPKLSHRYLSRGADPNSQGKYPFFGINDDGNLVELETPIPSWQEEVFADVCGALIGGPVMAFDFQELMKRYERSFFLGVDQTDDHPFPFLRPLIYTYALLKRGTPSAVTDVLDKRWENILLKMLKPSTSSSAPTLTALADELDSELSNEESSADADPFKKELLDTISKYMELVEGNLDDGQSGIELVSQIKVLVDAALAAVDSSVRDDWTAAVPLTTLSEQAADNLDAWFNENHQSLIKQSPPPLSERSNEDMWRQWIKESKFFDDKGIDEIKAPNGQLTTLGVGKDSLWFIEGPPNPKGVNPSTGDPEWTWQPLWFASGWTTDPGGGDPPGKP